MTHVPLTMSEEIIAIVEDVFGVRQEHFKSWSRKKEFCRPRWAVMALLSETPMFRGGRHSLSKIGDILNRHHTTVMHGITQAEELEHFDDEFAAKMVICRERVRELRKWYRRTLPRQNPTYFENLFLGEFST